MEQNQISVALVGLSFGLEFLPIYLEHPDVKEVWIVEKKRILAQVRTGTLWNPSRKVHHGILVCFGKPQNRRHSSCNTP